MVTHKLNMHINVYVLLIKKHVAVGPMHSCYPRKDMRIQRMEKERKRELEAEREEAIRIRVTGNCASRDIL